MSFQRTRTTTRLITRPLALLLPLALGAGVALAGCGDDDGATVRDLSEDTGSAATGSETADGSGSASASASAPAEADKPCEPVGEDLAPDAGETVAIDLVDYGFEPAEITVAPGVVTFAATNGGDELHELAFLPGGGPVPVTEDGEPDEDALADQGAFELESFGPGQTCDATYELEAGTYTLFCIVTAPDGETHYEKGMAGVLTVG